MPVRGGVNLAGIAAEKGPEISAAALPPEGRDGRAVANPGYER